jgi:putative transposase
VKYACIEEHRETFDVAMMCRVLSASRSGYYKWRSLPGGDRRLKEGRLLLEIRAVHRESRGTYGAPRIWRELRERGVECSRGQIERLMRREGIRGKSNRPQRKRRPAEEQASGPVAENVLARRFGVGEIGGINRVWVSDITYVPTRQGWLYLAIVMDLASRMVVGWSMSATQTSQLVLDALEMAVKSRRPEGGLLFHSDRGCQYTSRAFQERLAKYEMQCSMSRRGNCWDNAVAESAFATVECELIEGADWHTHNEARQDVFQYLEVWYNRRRRHSSLGYLSPVEHERRLEVRPRADALPNAA